MFFLLVFFCASAVERPTTHIPTIPLDTIWAWKMPGTKDVRELEPNHEQFKKMVADNQIQSSIAVNTFWRLNPHFKPKGNKNAGSAFVVNAVGLEALIEANAILAKRQNPKDNFKAGSPLTLVFYAYSSSQIVHIGQVVKEKNEIIVKYHFHVHGLRKSTQHYALIPLGDDLKGRIKITVERTEDTVEEYLASAKLPTLSDLDAKRLVSGSTVFRVLEPPD